MSPLHIVIRRHVSLFRISSLITVLTLILTPISPVFAQEATTTPESTEVAREQTAETVSASGEEESDPPPESLLDAEDPADENFGQRGAARQQTRMEPDSFDGSLGYSYPLTLPPGRNGLAPDLALVYSSRNTEQISPLGYGWSTNIPYIERIHKNGVNKLYTDDIFSSSFDGELKATSTVGYGALVENGDFRQYIFQNEEYWKVTDKYGTIYTFGTASTTQIASSTQVYRWLLEEVRDRNDNYIEYEYYKDNGQIYPYKIRYTGNGSTDGVYEIEFLRESRTDIATSSLPGFPIVSKYRIDEIQIKVNGAWQRKYELGYSTGDNTARTLLSSITDTGKDESGNSVTLPATSFAYASSSPNWTYSSSWPMPTEFVDDVSPYGNIDMGVRFDDFNGDGWTDLTGYYNNGDGTWATSTSAVGTMDPTSDSGQDVGVRTADVNGDGLADYWPTSGNVRLNTNRGLVFTESSTWSLPVSFVYNSDGYHHDLGTRIADINGDGLPDILMSRDPAYGANTGFGIYLNNGAGWNATTTDSWPLPTGLFFAGNQGGVQGVDYGVRFADFNGDGLTDIMRSRNSGATSTFIYINNGDRTWTTIEPAGFPEPIVGSSGEDNGIYIIDVNSDGLPDVVRPDGSSNNIAYINQGGGMTFTHDGDWTNIVPDFKISGQDAGARFVDINADGIVDIVRSYGGTLSPAGQNGAYIGNGVVPDLLKSITTDAGGITSVGYKASTRYKTGSAKLNPYLPALFQTVETLTTDNLFGTIGTTTYTYGGGAYYYASTTDKKFAGFASTTITDQLSNVTKQYFQQGNTTASELGEYADSKAKIGKLFRTEIYDSSGNLLKKQIDRWNSSSLSSGRDFVKRDRTTEYDYNSGTTHMDKATVFSYDDTIGNLSEKTEYGVVIAGTDGTFTDVAYDKRSTHYEYATSSANHIFAFPAIETIKNASSTRIAERKFYYDSLSYGSVNKGNLTKEERWISGGNYASSTKTYNAYGLVVTETDPRAKSTTMSYDSTDMFVATTTNAVGHVTEFYRDYTNGDSKKIVDPNGLSFETVFDGLDRVLTEKIPDHLGTPSNTVTRTSFTYTNTAGARTVQKTQNLNSATSTDEYTYFDGFLRPIQIRTEAESVYFVRDMKYDKRGNIEKESLPYESLGASRTSMTGTQNLLIDYTYDALNRPTTITNALGTATTTYGVWLDGAITANNGFPETNLISYWKLDEASGTRADTRASNALTDNNTVAATTGKLNNAADFETDTSEYLSITNGAQSGLGAAGSFSISLWWKGESYNGTDGLVSKFALSGLDGYLLYTAGSGTQLGSQIDNNDQQISTTLTTGTWYHVAWVYDAAGQTSTLYKDGSSIGSESGVSAPTTNTADFLIGDGVAAVGHYSDGLIDEVGIWSRALSSGEVSALFNSGSALPYSISTSTVVNAYRTATTTDAEGNVKVLFFDAFDNLVRVNEINSGSTYTTNYAYDPMQNLLRITDASSNVRNFTYDGLSRITLSEDLHASADTGFASTTYAYDLSGNVTSKQDGKNQIINFTYDDINRVLTENYTGSLGTEIEYGYDVCSNGKPRLCSATTTDAVSNLTYDALGNVATESRTIQSSVYATTFTRDRLGNLTNITYPSGRDVEYRYNAAGQLESVYTRPSGGSFTAVVSDLNYAPTGQAKYKFFGNEFETILTYDAGEMYRLTNLQTAQQATVSSIAADATLGTNLVSYWKLDETSGTRADSHGSNTLTDNNTVTSATGKINNAADFEESNNEYLSITNDSQSGLGITGSYSISLWSNIESFNGTDNLIGKFDLDNLDGYLFYTGTSGVKLGAQNDANDFGATANLSTATWYHLVVVYDSSAQTLTLYKNGSSLGSESSVAAPTANAAAFLIGQGILSTHYSDGLIDEVGVWSRALGSGEVSRLYASGNALPYSATASATSTIQDMFYTYDAVGNITQLADYSTSTGKIVAYTYDDLNRLTVASTTAASSTPYKQTYSYDSLGNILNKSDIGYYFYTGTDYANPHAVTQIATTGATTTYTYDSNGNMTTGGIWTYGWDYRNRLTSAGNGSATTTFGYDYSGQRVFSQTASSTTVFPSKYFSITSTQIASTTYASSTSYIYAGDTLVAYVEQDLINGTATGTPRTFYVHPDHLGSTNAITDENGDLVLSKDYLPYGSTRISSGDASLQRGYIGQFESENLLYLQARYMDPARGQFMSQDPVFNAIGSPNQVKQIAGLDQRQILMDPQLLNSARTMGGSNSGFASGWSGNMQSRAGSISQLEYLADPQMQNSYAYARGNPLRYKDPDGNFPALIPLIGYILTAYGAAQTGVSGYDYYITNVQYPGVFTADERRQSRDNLGYNVFLSAVGGSAGKVGLQGYGFALDALSATGDVMDHYFAPQIYQNINYNQIQLQSSAQSRQQFAQSYNSTFNLSTGGSGGAPSNNSLWVTPSGAVVTFGGQLVAPPPSN